MPGDTPRPFTRRTFLSAMGLGGVAALVSACTPAPAVPTTAPSPATAPKPATAPSPTIRPPEAVATTAAPAPPPTIGAAPSPVAKVVASPSPAAATPRLVVKPIPTEAFIPFGSNAEMRFEALNKDQYLVPAANFFVRNHAATPLIDEKTWKLSIQGSGVERPMTLSYDELTRLPSQKVTRYVECSGNGREFFKTFLNQPAQGTQWKLGAYGVAEWTGVPLSELLQRAGMKPSAQQVMGVGLDQPRVRRPIPKEKALEDDVMLVWAMNGQPLPADHGFPARLLVPGWGGISSIKWVGELQVSEEPIWTDWNTKSYVLIGPAYQPRPPAEGPLFNEQVMKSAVALPWPATLKAGQQTIQGYAWSPNGKIARVEVSTDGGRTFQAARLIEPNIEQAGVRWQFTFDARPGEMTITPRASDDAGMSQPVDMSAQVWNQLGYGFGVAVPHPVQVTS